MEKIGKSAKYLMATDVIYTITSLFANTFLVAYLLNVTEDNIVVVSLYNIILYFMIGLVFYISGYFVKKYPEKRLKILSFGIVIRAIFILSIVLLGEKISTYFILVAIFFGISEALYWNPHELVYMEITNNENRKKYFVLKKSFSIIAKIITPLILGFSIEYASFSKVAIYIFILSLLHIYLTCKINIKEFNIDNRDLKYDIKKYVNKIKDKKSLINLYKTSFLYGLVSDVIAVLVVIITIMTYKTSLNLGILTTIFSICSIGSMYVFKKYYNKNNSKKVLFTCSILIFFGIFGLLIDINKLTFVIYNFVYTVSFCILDIIYNTKKADIIKECNIQNDIVEHSVFSDLVMNIGRILGFSLMLICGLLDNILSFKILLFIVSMMIPLYSYAVYKIDNN